MCINLQVAFPYLVLVLTSEIEVGGGCRKRKKKLQKVTFDRRKKPTIKILFYPAKKEYNGRYRKAQSYATMVPKCVQDLYL